MQKELVYADRLQLQTTLKAPNSVTRGVITVFGRPHGVRPAMFRNRSSSAWPSLNWGTEVQISKQVQISKAWFPLELLKINPWKAPTSLVQMSAYHQKPSRRTPKTPRVSHRAALCLNWHPGAERVQLLHEEKDEKLPLDCVNCVLLKGQIKQPVTFSY